MIRETDKEGAVTVCGGGSRARTVYVSKLNHVELQIITDVNNIANSYIFLFIYEGGLSLGQSLIDSFYGRENFSFVVEHSVLSHTHYKQL